jgi:hypothetical protein
MLVVLLVTLIHFPLRFFALLQRLIQLGAGRFANGVDAVHGFHVLKN